MKKIFFLILVFPVTAGAFTLPTQKQILIDAAALCPPSLQAYLKKNIDAVVDGSTFMDRRGQKMPVSQTMAIYNYLAGAIKDTPDDYNITSKFGLLASVICNTVNPSRKCRGGDQATQPDIVIYDGHQKIDKTRFQALKPVAVNAAYNRAVNEIADCWISLWEDAGQEVKLYAQGTRINHKTTSLGVMSEKAKLLKAEREWNEAVAAEMAAEKKAEEERRAEEEKALKEMIQKEAEKAAKKAAPHGGHVTSTGNIILY